MLSRKYQYFLCMLLWSRLTRKECLSFMSNKSFYTMTSYLLRNNLIRATLIDFRGTKQYRLSMRGEILALVFESLENFKKEEVSRHIKKEI